MFPAARLGDPITHDQTVPSGTIGPPAPGSVPTVIIEGLPAATLGDNVTCTGATSAGPVHPPQAGPPPSVPPSVPIILGSPTVMINYKPAARWSVDTGACGVFLGDSKLVATRKVFIGDIVGGGGGGGGAGAGGLVATSVATMAVSEAVEAEPASAEYASPNQVGPLQPTEEVPQEPTWIGIILKNFDGIPIANENLQITLNDGTVLSGKTDAQGHARFEGISPGQGEVAFVNIPRDREEVMPGASQESGDEGVENARSEDRPSRQGIDDSELEQSFREDNGLF
jgi:uncharacterized Zn-binding protein involved in type VI secretion